MPCIFPCASCKNATRCITCINTSNRLQPPSCACRDTYYENPNQSGCTRCPVPGGICTSPTNYKSTFNKYLIINY